MLLVQLERFSKNIAIFGMKEGTSRPFDGERRLNKDYLCRSQSFQNIPRMYGSPFDTFEIGDVKFVGYLEVPYEALFEESAAGGSTLPELILWYVQHKVEVPFEQWISSNPLLNRRCGRRHLGVFYGYEGEVYLAFIEYGKVNLVLLTETCFIKNGYVTTLKDAIARHLAKVEKQLAAFKEHHAKLVSDPLDLASLLDRSEVLSFVDSRADHRF